MLGERQKAILKAAARGVNHPLWGQANEKMDEAIAQIQLECPNAFLEEKDYPERNFYHKPKQKIPYKSYVKETL